MDVEDSEGAYSFLSTVAGSMIGVTGITFSITIAALLQASSQYGPRLLNTFMRDRGNQIVLGTFISTYTYCLLILRSVDSTPGVVFIPRFSLFVAMVLTMMGVGILVYFFNHVATSMQAENIIAEVGRDLEDAIERLFPESVDYGIYQYTLRDERDLTEAFEEETESFMKSEISGYLQAVDFEELVKIAEKHDLTMRIAHRPGDFVTKDGELVRIVPSDDGIDEISKELVDAFIIGDQRLRINDVEFTVNQLVEIAVRALSSGVNDPFTTIACIDQLASGLVALVKRSIPAGYHYDSEDRLRVITDPLTFAGIIEGAFNQIRQNGYSSVAVTIRLLEAIKTIAPHTRTREQKVTLSKQAEMLRHASQQEVPGKWDREDIEERYQETMQALGQA
ncbi:MAG: DUF2254 domain-containing protein [Promethearchaeia archaeon]